MERAVAQLPAAEVLAFGLFLLPSLSADVQHTVGDCDLDIFVGIDAGHLGSDHHRSVLLVLLDPKDVLEGFRFPRPRPTEPLRPAIEHVFKDVTNGPMCSFLKCHFASPFRSSEKYDQAVIFPAGPEVIFLEPSGTRPPCPR